MAPELCPYCGKPAHPKGSDYACPTRMHVKAGLDAAAGKSRKHKRDTQDADGHQDGYSSWDASLGTKLTVGTKVGEYQIVDRIGEGGMGTVYSAVHPIIGKKVAIKVLSARLAKNKNATRRFVLEARAVNDIQHPGLVDIFSFGRLTDGRHYYVMEYLDGRNLGDVLRDRRRIPARELLPIFMEVARVLVAVHAKGIIHRDLKPENILLLNTVKPGGQKVKLVDFGLAKLLDGIPTRPDQTGPHTAAGINVGTPHYMSPEQCTGKKVDGRSDLYAVGVLLYECLTGRLPFDGRSPVDIWQMHVEKAPRPPSDLAPSAVPPALNNLILRLMAKRPEDRVQNASELCVLLEGLGADGTGPTAPGSTSSQTGGQDLRHLAHALSHPPNKADLMPLDSAARATALAFKTMRRAKPGVYDEMATTTEDLPILYMPDEEESDEERRKAIEDLGASLGLHIEKPASSGQEKEQISALVINLGASRSASAEEASGQADERHSIPVPAASGTLRRTTRPVEERTYVPPLSAMTPRPTPGARSTMDSSIRAEVRKGVVFRILLVLLLLAAATIVGFKVMK